MFHGQPVGEEMWRVQLGTGEVRMVTLDGLDEAFQQGIIDENTFVLAPGAMAWAKLRDAAGLDAPAPEPEQTPSLMPFAIEANPAAGYDVAALGYGAAPGELDLDMLDMSDDAFKRSGKGKVFAIVGALAVVGLGIFVATKLGAVTSVASVKNEASVTPAVAAAAAPPPVTDVGPKTLSVANLPNASDEGASKRPALSDDMKQKLADADKARDTKAKSKAAEKAAKASTNKPSSGSRQKGKAPFVNGGDKFDPLNGNL